MRRGGTYLFVGIALLNYTQAHKVLFLFALGAVNKRFLTN